MIKLILSSAFYLTILISHTSAWSQKSPLPVLRIATGELPPYATETRADKGIALSIVRRAFALAGFQTEFTFLPWSRALAESRLGKWDGTAIGDINQSMMPALS